MDDFGVKSKVAITVDKTANMDVAEKRMQIMKMGCSAHNPNAAQKLYNMKTAASWSGRIQAVIVWLRKASLVKPFLKEKKIKRFSGKLKVNQKSFGLCSYLFTTYIIFFVLF